MSLCQWKTGGREKNGEIDQQGTLTLLTVKLLLLASQWGHSPFCKSLLLWGRTFPQRSPEQTEPSVRGQKRQAG